jgi:hypothetical protein
MDKVRKLSSNEPEKRFGGALDLSCKILTAAPLQRPSDNGTVWRIFAEKTNHFLAVDNLNL